MSFLPCIALSSYQMRCQQRQVRVYQETDAKIYKCFSRIELKGLTKHESDLFGHLNILPSNPNIALIEQESPQKHLEEEKTEEILVWQQGSKTSPLLLIGEVQIAATDKGFARPPARSNNGRIGGIPQFLVHRWIHRVELRPGISILWRKSRVEREISLSISKNEHFHFSFYPRFSRFWKMHIFISLDFREWEEFFSFYSRFLRVWNWISCSS